MAAAIQALVDPRPATVEPAVDPIAAPVQAPSGCVVPGTFGAVGRPVQTTVGTVAAAVETLLDTVAASVQALFDTVAAMIGPRRPELGPYGGARGQQEHDPQRGYSLLHDALPVAMMNDSPPVTCRPARPLTGPGLCKESLDFSQVGALDPSPAFGWRESYGKLLRKGFP